MKLYKIKIFSGKVGLIIAALLFALPVWANDFPNRPNPPRLVNDLANLFDNRQANALEQALVQFNNQTSTQIAVVTLPDLKGYDVGDYSFQLAEKWGIGQKGKNNGILILIKPKTSSSKGQAFVATGYGLEGVVPDAVARRVVDNEMIPHFRSDDYFHGVVAGINVIMELTRGEYSADGYMSKTSKTAGIISFIIVFIFIVALTFIGSGFRQARNSSIGGSIPLLLLLSFLGSGSSRSHSGRWGDFNSGGGSFRSSGRGGFGGFGGGSFGGGGAGGSW